MSFVFLTVGILTYLGVFLVFWVLMSFGVYRMAKHAGIPHAWVALLPLGNGFVTGLLAERALYTYTGRQKKLALWNPVLQALGVVGIMGVIGLALLDMDFNAWVVVSLVVFLAGSTAAWVVYLYSLYYIFKDYAPDNATLYTVLGIVLGIYWIFLLVEMNTVPVSVAGYGPFPYRRPKYDRFHQWQAGPMPQYSAPQGPNAAGWAQGSYQPQPPPQQPGQGYAPYQGEAPRFYQGQQGYYRPEQPQPPKQEDHQGPELK